MHPKVTSKEELLNISKQIVKEDGIDAINIRVLANRCDIAVGSIYNYFSSKEVLLISVVEAIWNEIFNFSDMDKPKNTVDLVERILDSVESGKKIYPDFIGLHALSFNKNNRQDAKKRMKLYFDRFKTLLRTSLDKDAINWNYQSFSKDDLTDIIFNLIFSQLIFDINKTSILQMLKVIIYGENNYASNIGKRI